jgi:cytidylate kinase
MRHVLVYGPPAAGKLTVAAVLAERHQMALLDNHLTFDVALRVDEFGTPTFGELVGRLRFALYEGAAAAGRDIVSTFVFSSAIDRGYTDALASQADRLGVTLHRVHLCPPREVLEARVTEPSRATTQKIRDRDTLRGIVAAHDFYTSIDDGDLRIDNSDLSVGEVVDKITAEFGL